VTLSIDFYLPKYDVAKYSFWMMLPDPGMLPLL